MLKTYKKGLLTHEGRLEGLYINNDNYDDVTPSSSSTGI
jgi:hypothetical protein